MANVLWGTVFVASGVALRYAPAVPVVFLRFTVGGLAACAVGVVARRRWRVGAELRRWQLWVVGGILAIAYLAQYVGQSLTSASAATLLVNLSPVLVPPVAYLLLGEPVGSKQKAATLLALVGLVVVTAPDLLRENVTLLGDLVLFGGSIAFTLYIVFSKRWEITAISGGLALLVPTAVLLAAPAFLFGLTAALVAMPPVGWAAIVWLGIPCSVLASVLYQHSLEGVSASQAATLILLQVLLGLLLALILLGEAFTVYRAIGAGLIAGAVILSAYGPRRGPAAPGKET